MVQWINGFDKKQVVSGSDPERANTNPDVNQCKKGACGEMCAKPRVPV